MFSYYYTIKVKQVGHDLVWLPYRCFYAIKVNQVGYNLPSLITLAMFQGDIVVFLP